MDFLKSLFDNDDDDDDDTDDISSYSTQFSGVHLNNNNKSGSVGGGGGGTTSGAGVGGNTSATSTPTTTKDTSSESRFKPIPGNQLKIKPLQPRDHNNCNTGGDVVSRDGSSVGDRFRGSSSGSGGVTYSESNAPPMNRGTACPLPPRYEEIDVNPQSSDVKSTTLLASSSDDDDSQG